MRTPAYREIIRYYLAIMFHRCYIVGRRLSPTHLVFTTNDHHQSATGTIPGKAIAVNFRRRIITPRLAADAVKASALASGVSAALSRRDD